MGVYIKGMEMPTSCRRCDFSQPDGCGFFCTIAVGKPIIDSLTHSRHVRCPLIPIPPHGRLIDADKLRKAEFIHDGDAYAVVMSRDIEQAPTIIPAEEDE